MTKEDALETVSDVLRRIVAEKGEEISVDIKPDLLLLGGELPIDSLDLATIVVDLEAATGTDPFKDGFIYFRTVGELAKLYVS